MGLFSSKTYYFTDISTSPLMTKTPPNYFVSSIVNAIQENTDISFTVFRSYVSGPSSSLRRFLRYGKNNYYYGLPTTTSTVDIFDYTGLETVLESIEGEGIIFEDLYFGERDDSINALIYLYKNYNFDLQTLKLTTSCTVRFGLPTTCIWNYNGTSNGGTTANFLRTETETDWEGNTYTTTYTYQINGIPTSTDQETSWYIALYSTLSNPTVTKIFEYKTGSGVYPTLDAEVGAVDDIALPIPIMRSNNTWVDNQAEQIYSSTKGLLNTMNLNIDELLGQLKTGDNISKVTNIFFHFSPLIHSNITAINKYLYAFFDSLQADFETRGGITKVNNLVGILGILGGIFRRSLGTYSKNSIKITEQRFDYAFNYTKITRETKTGVIGNIGAVTKTLDIYTRDNALNTRTEGSGEDSYEVADPILESKIILRKQISSTQYTEIVVFGPYVIHKPPQTNGAQQVKYIYLKDSEDFTVPLIPDLLFTNISIIDQETVIFRSLMLLAYAADQQKVSWFENFLGSILGQFLIVFLITWIFPPFGTWMAGSTTAFSSALFWQAVAINFAVAMVITKVLMPLLGDNPLLFAIAAMAVGFYAQSLMNPFQAGNLSFADYLLTDVKSIMKFGDYLTGQMIKNDQLELDELKKVEEQIQSDYDNELNRLAEIESGLFKSYIDPSMLSRKPMDRYYKNTGDFFTRSLRTNLATIMKEAPSDSIRATKDCWSTIPQII